MKINVPASSTQNWPAASDLESDARGIIEGEKNLIANLANLAALFYHALPGLNWAGFYLWNEDDGELVLGPFQGKPACIRIAPSRGVCGAAYTTRQMQRVDDVHAFPGHIACDAASRSELVIPLLHNGRCVGVLDLDAPVESHFPEAESARLQSLMQKLTPILFS